MKYYRGQKKIETYLINVASEREDYFEKPSKLKARGTSRRPAWFYVTHFLNFTLFRRTGAPTPPRSPAEAV